MISVRALREKLKSVKSIGQFTSAMKSVSTAKFGKLSSLQRKYAAYASACRDTAKHTGVSVSAANTENARDIYVIFTGNRSLCGDYNSALCRFAAETVPKDAVLCCFGNFGRLHLREKLREADVYFDYTDIPAFEEASRASVFIKERFSAGEAKRVYLIYQSFINMLRQEPVCVPLFAEDDTDGEDGDGTVYVPDRESVKQSVTDACLGAEMYSALLEAALGAQAATVMAMRTASDNANALYDRLLLTMNRKRQSTVTSDVIETSSRTIDNQ